MMIKLCESGFRSDFAPRMGLIVANSITGLSTIVTNLLLIISILRTPSLRKPSHILIANLAVADFLVGAIGQPMFILRDTLLLQKREDFLDIVCITSSVGRAFSYWPSTVSLYTLLVISMDRVLAIKLKTRYSSVVTSKRLIVVLLFGWILNALVFFSLFLLLDAYSILVTVSFGMMLFIITISSCYLKAMNELRKVISQVSHSENNTSPINTASSFDVSKYKQSLKTMLIVFASLMFCCFPYVISTAILALNFEKIAGDYVFLVSASEVIVFANSTLNPLLYFWRLKELRYTAGKIMASLIGRKCQETTA